MALIRLNPVRELVNLQRDLDRLLELPLGDTERSFGTNVPAMQVWEANDAYTVQFLLPGVERQSLSIEASANALTVSGKLTFSVPANAKLRHGEFGEGGFRRSLKFSQAIQTDAVNAEYVDGLLSLTLPKADVPKVVKVHLNGSSDQQLVAAQN